MSCQNNSSQGPPLWQACLELSLRHKSVTRAISCYALVTYFPVARDELKIIRQMSATRADLVTTLLRPLCEFAFFLLTRRQGELGEPPYRYIQCIALPAELFSFYLFLSGLVSRSTSRLNKCCPWETRKLGKMTMMYNACTDICGNRVMLMIFKDIVMKSQARLKANRLPQQIGFSTSNLGLANWLSANKLIQSLRAFRRAGD